MNSTSRQNQQQNSGQVEDRYEMGWDWLIASGPISDGLFSEIMREVSERQKHERLVLCLSTYGGYANSGYRIGKYLQSSYEDITIFVPSVCKSAGTLVACAANTIALSHFGELGPLDVQLLKKDELYERRSGLITSYALEELKRHAYGLFEHFMLNIKTGSQSISFKMASEIAAAISSDIMEDVYARINVDALGEDARNLRVATEYGDRLNRRFENLVHGATSRLVHGYPSHDFVIDIDEARSLFARVEVPTESLYAVFSEHASQLISPSSQETATLLPGGPSVTKKVGGKENEQASSQKPEESISQADGEVRTAH